MHFISSSLWCACICANRPVKLSGCYQINIKRSCHNIIIEQIKVDGIGRYDDVNKKQTIINDRQIIRHSDWYSIVLPLLDFWNIDS